MESTKEKTPQVHALVCTRQKEKGACCAEKGSKELIQELKLWMKEEDLKGPLKITATQCLGHCESGIAIGIHPHNEWLIKVSKEDLPELKQKLTSLLQRNES